jgi:hypothetical protein
MAAVIDYYANGYTPLADPSRIELVRHIESRRDSGDKRYLSGDDVKGDYPLQHFDEIYVPAITDLAPVMFVEGAVSVAVAGGTEVEAELTAANKITVRYNDGENYASLVQRNNQAWFSPISDTQNAYIIRGEKRIPINLNPMLYDSSYRSEYYVEENDTLIIPFRQYFITVAGAVAVPGRYPYIPDRSWDYYVALAGGFNRSLNSREAVTITSMEGKKLGKGEVIAPETVITANTNAGLYYFNQYAPVITTILGLAATVLSILAVTGAFN